MRILKYILLLLVLIVVAGLVYFSTLSGAYQVSRSKVLHIDKSTVFQYINDYRNWEDWCALKDFDSSVKYYYSEKTIGEGSTFEWKGSSFSGKLKTIYIKENDSITQKQSINNVEANAYITLKDTFNGTKIVWNCKGTLDFWGKIKTFFFENQEDKIGAVFEKSLYKLQDVLHHEISRYSIEENGIVSLPKEYFLKQKVELNPENFYSNLQQLMPELENFAVSNSISSSQPSFISYTSNNISKNPLRLEIGVPIKEVIFTSQESQFTCDSIPAHQAIKITLKGDYSHTRKAWKKAMEYLLKNKLEASDKLSYREVYVKNNRNIKNPSEWLTHIYIPLAQNSRVKVVASDTLPSSE